MSLRSPRERSPIPSNPDQDQAPSRSLRSRSRQDSQPRDYSRSPSPDHADRQDRHSRSRSRSSSRGPSKGGRRYRSRSRSYSRSPSRSPSPPRSAKIVVEKLTKNVTEAHLREIFGSFGDIEHLELPMNRAFMTNRGTAYIIYYDPADAEAAIAHMHEAQLDGAVLNRTEETDVAGSAKALSRTPLREDMVVLDLPRDMTHTDLNRGHDRDPLFDRAHILVSSLRQEEGVPETKAQDSADDEALATVVTATVVAVSGAGAQTEVAVVAVAAIGAE
ncbi:Serine/arginine-rich splicing factor SR45 [Penicillium herquei]|nr:Serine/arginine-rich splicing factor SR45 [Penicillium herquei]